MTLFPLKKVAITLIIMTSYSIALSSQPKSVEAHREANEKALLKNKQDHDADPLRPSLVLNDYSHKFFNHGQDNPGELFQRIEATTPEERKKYSAACCVVLVYRRNAVGVPRLIASKNVPMDFTIGDLARITGTETLYRPALLTTTKEEAELDRAKQLSGNALAEHYKNALSTIIMPKLKAKLPFEAHATLDELLQKILIGRNSDSILEFDGLMPEPPLLNNAPKGSAAYHSALPEKWPNQIEAEERLKSAQKEKALVKEEHELLQAQAASPR